MSADILYAVAAWLVLVILLAVWLAGMKREPISAAQAVVMVINFTAAILLALVAAGRIR